eukprot:scaffold11544_cov101-Skeletonema_dohrnii-CCMP3373.AAC.7
MKLVSAALVVLSTIAIAPSMANGYGTVRQAKADKCNSFSETVNDLLEQLEDIDTDTGAGAGSSAIAIEAPAEAKDMGIIGTNKAARFLLHATKAAVASAVELGIIGQGSMIYTAQAALVVALTDETKEEKALLLASLGEMATANSFGRPIQIDIIELFKANLGLDDKELDDFLLSLGGYV